MVTYPSTFEIPTTDPLTGLLSQPYFRRLLREELIPAAQRSGDPLSVFLIDTDSFLEVNTAHGRQAGDAVLLGVARVLRETLPEGTALVRYGGDEFCGALPDT
ncbi:MAG: GGDEF domain-containing protein, partial [Vicinamibacterales bacterium]